MQFQSFKEISPIWALADSFTVVEAAALIAGFDPSSIDSSLEYFKDRETGLTCSNGIGDFHAAFSVIIGSIKHGKLNSRIEYVAEPRFVAGIDMLHERAYWGNDDVSEVSGSDGEKYVVSNVPSWNQTTISRHDLDQWLGCKGLTLHFFSDDTHRNRSATPNESQRLRQLEAENARLVEQVVELQRQLQEATATPQQAAQDSPESTPVRRWPWGDHHTEALGHLEAAGVRFWQWFDPTDHTTAKTNDVVIKWLITERGATAEKARTIASLLRADGLKPGPRR